MLDISDLESSLIHNPSTLQDASLCFICNNIDRICCIERSGVSGEAKLRFKQQIFFHTELSEQLLMKLCELRKLDDLMLTVFNTDTTRLKQVKLNDASKLSLKGLRTLKGHKILELEAMGLTRATVTDLISCLGEWSLQNLRLLNVSNSTFMDSNKFCVVVALSKLRNLQVLNVARTEFNKTSLELVVEDLPRLESLNISCSHVNDISALRKCRTRLKVLSMSGLKFPLSVSETIVDILSGLTGLVHLDVSDDTDSREPCDILSSGARFKISKLLRKYESLPNLHSMDISGKEEINTNELAEFLACHKLRFLGLVLSEVCRDPMFTDSTSEPYYGDIVIAGFGSENQILEALHRYLDRPYYIQKTLYHLFKMTTGNYEPAIDVTVPRIDIIKMVLSCAKKYPTVLPIQMAVTACLFNLSKADLCSRIHPGVLKEIVQIDLDAMETFPQHQQLQKNVLLTIDNNRILQEVEFDKYRCVKLVLDCLCSWQDNSMNRMSVEICSILAAKISTEEISELSELSSQANYMKKLLSIVRERTQDSVIDITMKLTLSALWNLTDESPKTCQAFLDENGMELFIEVLNLFPGELAIETKVLGLFNNIAEVPSLRRYLMVNPFIQTLRNLLHSSSIEVSYFAAGIVAHLSSNSPDQWSHLLISKNVLSCDLWAVVSAWKFPEEEMVAYRSFSPFFSLLHIHQDRSVQLWAIWAIHHVCSRNPRRYCSMLKDQGGHSVLLNLVREPGTNHIVANITEKVLHTLVENGLIPQDENLREREIFVGF